MTTTDSTEARQTAALIDAPADADEAVATGYAVFDRTVGQYVGGKTADKPTDSAIRKAVRKGHTGVAVRV